MAVLCKSLSRGVVLRRAHVGRSLQQFSSRFINKLGTHTLNAVPCYDSLVPHNASPSVGYETAGTNKALLLLINSTMQMNCTMVSFLVSELMACKQGALNQHLLQSSQPVCRGRGFCLCAGVEVIFLLTCVCAQTACSVGPPLTRFRAFGGLTAVTTTYLWPSYNSLSSSP